MVLQFSRTYLPALVCSSHKRRPPWKYLVLVLRTMLEILIFTLTLSYFQTTIKGQGFVCPLNEGLYCDLKSETYDWGMGPRIFSIMARCSLLSWVWNSVNPRYSSKAMQPMLQMSQGWLQPSSRITSGALR